MKAKAKLAALVLVLAVIALFSIAIGPARGSLQDPGGGPTACGPGITYATYYGEQYIYVIRCSDGTVVAVYPR